jgi:hypothetical protein
MKARDMKTLILLLCFAVLSTFCQSQGLPPRAGYVPDSATAVRIAEAVLMPIYGKEHIESERPFIAELKDRVWTGRHSALLQWKRRLYHNLRRRSCDRETLQG